MSQAIIVYYRHGCHLCEQMVTSLNAYRQTLDFDVQLVDIDTDLQLQSRYNADVPVVLFKDEVIFYHFFDEVALLAALGKNH